MCPLKLISQFNADYVIAYEADPVQQMSIRLEGIVHMSISEERFEYKADALLGGWEEPLPVRKPFVAKIRLKEIQQLELWHGYAIRDRQDQIYFIEFHDTDAFLQHLFRSEWEELLSPGWLRRKLQQRAEHLLDRLAVQREANVE